jgi:hypothetical protein
MMNQGQKQDNKKNRPRVEWMSQQEVFHARAIK